MQARSVSSGSAGVEAGGAQPAQQRLDRGRQRLGRAAPRRLLRPAAPASRSRATVTVTTTAWVVAGGGDRVEQLPRTSARPPGGWRPRSPALRSSQAAWCPAARRARRDRTSDRWVTTPRSTANWPSTSPQPASSRSCSARGSTTNCAPRTGTTAVSVWRCAVADRAETGVGAPGDLDDLEARRGTAAAAAAGPCRWATAAAARAQRRPRRDAGHSQVAPRGSHSQTGWPPARAKLATAGGEHRHDRSRQRQPGADRDDRGREIPAPAGRTARRRGRGTRRRCRAARAGRCAPPPLARLTAASPPPPRAIVRPVAEADAWRPAIPVAVPARPGWATRRTPPARRCGRRRPLRPPAGAAPPVVASPPRRRPARGASARRRRHRRASRAPSARAHGSPSAPATRRQPTGRRHAVVPVACRLPDRRPSPPAGRRPAGASAAPSASGPSSASDAADWAARTGPPRTPWATTAASVSGSSRATSSGENAATPNAQAAASRIPTAWVTDPPGSSANTSGSRQRRDLAARPGADRRRGRDRQRDRDHQLGQDQRRQQLEQLVGRALQDRPQPGGEHQRRQRHDDVDERRPDHELGDEHDARRAPSPARAGAPRTPWPSRRPGARATSPPR